ncbi:hypothetical protein B1H10_00125 [candidate division KSB1 bacterium 4484_188]|nr:MAG: hypothetical protein B1H10_00125 [candidate division KSB1 bacterium 4484_188]
MHFRNGKYKFVRIFGKKPNGGLMKKGLIGLLVFSLVFLFLAGCSKKVSEKEYFDRAYQYMGKENMGAEKWSKAEENFQKVLDEYPNGEFAAKSLFMIGFINANYLKNYDKAKKYYSEFLQKYPKNDLADDAKYEIENLGKNIDDLPFLREDSVKEENKLTKPSQKVPVSSK